MTIEELLAKMMPSLLLVALTSALTAYVSFRVHQARAEAESRRTQEHHDAQEARIHELEEALSKGLGQFRSILDSVSDRMLALADRLNSLQVTLIGLDGQNGLRSDVRSLKASERALSDKLIELEQRLPRTSFP